MVTISHGSTRYVVSELVAEAATYRLYICSRTDTGEQRLLQIATGIEHNGGLDRTAFVLQRFKQASDRFEAANAKQSPDYQLNFDRLFPNVVDSFVSDEQNKRRVNILLLKDVDVITAMAPLSNLRVRDRRRVDIKTSVWIMGRLLKLLNFSHSQGVAVQLLTDKNVLIGPERHFVVVLDWTGAFTYQSEVPADARRDDIVRATQVVFVALGGDPATGSYPYVCDDTDQQYLEHLRGLMAGRSSDAEQANRQFYDLVNGLYGVHFHPFRTLPL